MSPTEAVLLSWSFPPWVTALNLLAALLYLRGWLELKSLVPARLGVAHLFSFFAGIAMLQIALASPIDVFDAFFLTGHMSQHMLLMMVVPPFVLFGSPVIPMMRGLPRPVRRAIGRVIKWKPLEFVLRVTTRPALCWFAFALAMIGWHLPRPYDLALRSSSWHHLEHFTFLIAAMLFWWPVIQPWPSRPYWPRWSIILYLVFADIVNSILSAFLVFSGRVLYQYYLAVPRLSHLSVANDQVLAGAVMWVVGSVAFIIPAVAIALRVLSPQAPAGSPPAKPLLRRSPRKRLVLSAAIFLLPIAALAYGFHRDDIDIDDAVVRAQSSSGPLAIALFAPQGNLATRKTDVAVLVRDAATNAPMPGATVRIAIHSASQSGDPVTVPALPKPATNRLLHGAQIDVPSAGTWEINVIAQDKNGRTAALSCRIEAK